MFGLARLKFYLIAGTLGVMAISGIALGIRKAYVQHQYKKKSNDQTELEKCLKNVETAKDLSDCYSGQF